MGHDDEGRDGGWDVRPLDVGLNGHGNGTGGPGPYGGEDEEYDEAGPTPAGGRWVSRGGVMAWEEPPAASEAPPDPRAEAGSRWAADDVELPPGAPDGSRIRAVRAWLLRRREAENEALGALLLERRRTQGDEEARQSRRGPAEDSPLDLAMAEHQAAADEYERMVELLADLETHSGPHRLLVEYYLALTERLAELAAAPEAPPDFAPELRAESPRSAARPPEPRAVAEWEGRASAATQARRRVERVTQPETEE